MFREIRGHGYTQLPTQALYGQWWCPAVSKPTKQTQRCALKAATWCSLKKHLLTVEVPPGSPGTMKRTLSWDSHWIALGKDQTLKKVQSHSGSRKEPKCQELLPSAQGHVQTPLPHSHGHPTWVPAELAWEPAWKPRALSQSYGLGILALCKVTVGLCWQLLLLLVWRAVPIVNHHRVFTVLELQSQRGLFRARWRSPWPDEDQQLCQGLGKFPPPWACWPLTQPLEAQTHLAQGYKEGWHNRVTN